MGGRQVRLSLVEKDGTTIVRRLRTVENRQIQEFRKRARNEQRTPPAIIKFAHDRDLWFACRCHYGGGPFPLAVPFYSNSGSFSLRVLLKKRPPHDLNCPFFRHPSGMSFKNAWYRKPRVRPDGLFEVLKKKAPQGQAAGTVTSSGTSCGNSTGSVSAASEELLRLLEVAGLNRYRSAKDERPYGVWKRRIKQATQGINIAPGRALSSLWFDSPGAWTDKAVHGKLRDAGKRWPRRHEAQAFLCLPVNEIDNRKIGIVRCPNRVELGCRITMREIYGHEVGGPYLLIGVAGIGDSEVQCMQAYAQPIVSSRIPMPVDSDYERRTFFSLKFRLNKIKKIYPGASFEIVKPLFEEETDSGPCIPDFKIKFRGGGPTVKIVLEVMGMKTSDYYKSKAETHPRMAEKGKLLTIDATRFPPRGEGLGPEAQRIFDQIVDELSRKWGRPRIHA